MISRGDHAIIVPSDADDPLACDWKGEEVIVLRTREAFVSPYHVYVQLAEPINGDARRAVFRSQDLRGTHGS